jgi:hypothetical protein
MLEELLPPEANMLDTLVVTHDDADHMKCATMRHLT